MEQSNVKENPWGMSASIDIYNCDLAIIKSPAAIQDYVIQLCKLIDMKRFGDCQVVHFGTGSKEGLTLVQLIETSNITGHFSNDTRAAYIDIFSCKMFSPDVVAEFTQKFFNGDNANVAWCYRQ